VSEPIGVLAMAYGTASGTKDVERYYTDIRGGRSPSPELLRELKDRYAAIGNRFPLLEITKRQAAALERVLNADGSGSTFRVYLGMKHAPPFIADGVRRMRADGIERAVGLVLAPHWSGMSVETYVERVEKALVEGGPSFTHVRAWYGHPLFVDFLSSRVADALGRLPADRREDALVVFTAHSLPTRNVAEGGPRCKECHLCPDACRYVEQLSQTADLVSHRLGLEGHSLAWQSAGRTPDPWWGPSLAELIPQLAKAGREAVVVCACGFVADHLEILYDLDIEGRGIAQEAGIDFVRTEMPNADPGFISALGAVVREHVQVGAWSEP